MTKYAKNFYIIITNGNMVLTIYNNNYECLKELRIQIKKSIHYIQQN